mgnify:CR=1 FL=1
MATINDRVKELRKSEEIGLTLEKFGKSLGVGKSAISDIENGRNNVSEQMFNSICREFNVNPSWLRDGSGEMFVKRTRDEEIEAFINSALSEESDSFRKRLISVLSRLDLEGWKVLEKMAMELAAAHDEEYAAEKQQDAAEKQRDEESRKLHEELDRQLNLEKSTRRSSESSAG